MKQSLITVTSTAHLARDILVALVYSRRPGTAGELAELAFGVAQAYLAVGLHLGEIEKRDVPEDKPT